MELRYGINPHQEARIAPVGEWPFEVLSGEPSAINILDALNGWALVREAAEAMGRVSAASFKHVSPAGVAVAGDIDATAAECWGIDDRASDALCAYVRARDCDPKCSFGDMIALSHEVDHELAEFLMHVVSDGIIAPSYAPGVVERLSTKKKGAFLVLRAIEEVALPEWEVREIGGVRIEQQVDRQPITSADLGAGDPLAAQVEQDALLGMITARYTQSNTVVYTRHGMTVGIGAGQQSRVDCTRLAGEKTDVWWMRRHRTVRTIVADGSLRRQDRFNLQMAAAAERTSERTDWLEELDDVVVAHDGFVPFRDNIDEAARHGVVAIIEPGGSVRTDDVDEACREHQITRVQTGLRLFHH